MIIDISTILLKNNEELNFSLSSQIDTSFLIKGKVDNFDGDISVVGVVKNISKNNFEVSANIKTKLILCCDRCLKNLTLPIDIDIVERFFSGKTDDDEVYSFRKEKIDLSKAIVDNIFLSLPSSVLCSKDCKGISGYTILKEEINNNEPDTNNPFESLRALLKTEEED